MTADGTDAAAIEDRIRVRGVRAGRVDSGSDRNLPPLGPQQLQISMGHRRCGEVEDDRVRVSHRSGEAERIGTEDRTGGSLGDDGELTAGNHPHRHPTVARKGLEVGPQGTEVMGIAQSDDGDTGVVERLVDHRPRLGECGLGEAVVTVDADIGRADYVDARFCCPICPTAGQRIEVSGHAKDSVAESAVAFTSGAVGRQHFRNRRGGSCGSELGLDRRDKIIERDAVGFVRHCALLVCSESCRLRPLPVISRLPLEQSSILPRHIRCRPAAR